MEGVRAWWRDVRTYEDADGFGKDHDEGSAEVYFQELGEGDFLVVAGPPPGVAGFFSSQFRLLNKEGGGVGFFEGADEDPGDCGEDHDDPVGPSPAEVLGGEAAYDRAKGWAEGRLVL